MYAQLIASDLVLLHSVNTLLSSVSLPTLHNVLDATPYLLILLYEALPPTLVPLQKRKCIPFVERLEPNACFGSRFKNLKLLIGSIACDPELGLSRRTKQNLADLDLAGFCEKDVDAVRGLLGMFVEVVKSAGLDGSVAGDSQSEGELERSVSTVGERRTSSGVVPKPPKFGRGMMLRSRGPVASLGIDVLPPTLRSPSLRSDRFLGVDDRDGEYERAESPYQSENFWPPFPPSSIPSQRAAASRTVPEERLPYLLSSRASTLAKTEAALVGDDSADDSDISLIPLPPSPPTHARYLALKESLPSLPRHTGGSRTRPSLVKGSRAASQASFPSTIYPQEPYAMPLPVNTNSHNQIGEACPDREEERSDDERTSLISVSSASWGADSFYTTNLQNKRAEALERLHRAEERSEQEISAVNLGVQCITETERPIGGVEDEGYIENETTHPLAIPIGYDDFIAEEDLHQFEQDGTIAVEMLEELVRKLLVRRGYKILE
jgi:hypothetical protein